jgi:Ca2+-binding RTX toxin-like protein
MRRLRAGGLVVAAVALAGTPPAWAALIQGTRGADRLVGTAGADRIFGRGGADRLAGRGGADLVHGGPGTDTLAGERGDDRLASHYDDAADSVGCGPGRDVVNAEPRDRVAADCEVVSLQVSRDRYTTSRAQHETQVEPDGFAWGNTMVTTFQAGRFVDGGAANVGWATTRDGGRTWRTGLLPALSIY